VIRVEVVRVSDTVFEIILKPRKQIVTLRLNYDTVQAYEKLVAQLNAKNNSNVRLTRTHLMTVILEKIIEKPYLLEEILK
jgi:hypothetical protein